MRARPFSHYRSCHVVMAVCVLVLSLSSAAFACTSVLVTPGASVDGSATVTHTADCGSCAFEIEKAPAKDWAPGSMVEVPYLPQWTGGQRISDASKPTGAMIPQVGHTYGYIKGLFGMINEKQVGIGETTIGGRADFGNKNGMFDITNLSMLAMERGATAREAIQVMGDLAVKYGYKDSGEELSVSDTKECWVFEIVGPGALWSPGDEEPGAFWAAARVPDGHVAVSSNSSVIPEIDFDDQESFMVGPGIREFAEEKGWWTPESGKKLNWRFDFCDRVRPDYSYRRIVRIFSLVAPQASASITEANPPFSIKAERKLAMADIAKLHRDHYEGSQFDQTTSITAGPWANPRRYPGWNFKVDGKAYSFNRTISAIGCEYVIMTQSRGWLPNEIGGVLWYGPAVSATTCFVPFYNSVSKIADCIGEKSGSHMEFTRESLWWAVSTVNTLADLRWSLMITDINVMQDAWEGKAMREQAAVDAQALELYSKDPALACAFLTDYCGDNAYAVRDAWWAFLDKLLWKYNAGFINDGTKISSPGYPEAWLKKVVGLDEADHYAR
ncbi:MAG: C69 family dipeptidase [Clostridia bacterium]|nr:C69 family dipeptidase [Clostridia bacterium]